MCQQLIERKPGTKKYICNILHWLTPCLSCKELIWTSTPSGRVCNQCFGMKGGGGLPGNYRDRPSTPYSETQYNG